MKKILKTNAKISPEATEFKNSLSSVLDGLVNPLYGVTLGLSGGSTQVSQVDTFFKNNRWYLISNIRQVLNEIYVEHGIVQTLVDIPVEDAFRGGVTIKTEQLDEYQLTELEISLKAEKIYAEFKQAVKWTRLFGGGGLIIITDQDPATKLDISKLAKGARVKFHAVDLWELYYGTTVTEGDYTEANIQKEPEFYNYYGKKIHKSRVIRMQGKPAPSLVRPRLRGWGFSVIESVVRSYNQYLKSVNLAFEVMDEFKLDIYSIDGFNNKLLTSQGSNAVVKRIQMANMLKNYQNALVLDTKDTFANKQLSFTGVAEMMKEIRMQIAADLRMPLTKLFGISAAGFNSGEDDIENYNGMIESEIRAAVEYDFHRLLAILCQIKFGFVPDDLTFEFKPLRELNAIDQETVKNNQMQRVSAAVQAGLMTVKEAKQAINRANLLPVKIQENDEIIEIPEQTSEALGSDIPALHLRDTRSNSKNLLNKLQEIWTKK